MKNKLLTKLVLEGFPTVYERHDDAGKIYELHCHQDKVSFYVINGSVTFTFEDGLIHTVSAGDRFDVPPKIYHSAVVGEEGCDYIVGQMNDDDA